jgi:pimeloyl-ACP methyl ester carboxylesterase
VSAGRPPAPSPDREGRLVHERHGYHWELWGTGTRETVCLFNGLAMSTKSWLSFLPELTGDRDVILYDYLGQGASDDAALPGAPISDFGDALAGILDAAGHVVYLERPDLFWPRVRRFFGSKD